MTRPRFHKLPRSHQEVILGAALDEFATHGFNAASLNRIIDAAGISKGSMYYYFDGKEDLYAHVVRVELGRLFDEAGPFPVPGGRDPESFWATLEGYYVRVMTALAASPQLAALVRGWLMASGNPSLQQAQKEMEEAALPWFEQVVTAGQSARAVRKDVPSGLLIALVFGMGQAIDTWLLMQRLDGKAFLKLMKPAVRMFRRALQP